MIKANFKNNLGRTLLQGIGVIIFSLLICLQVTSCKKYLDERQNNALTVPETIADLQGLLDDASLRMNQSLTPCFGESSADDYFLPQSIYDARTTLEQQVYIFQPSEYNFSNDWAKSYAAVYNANYCLETIDKIEKTAKNEPAWNNVKGSALFYRSYNFLNLTWNFAKAFDQVTSNSDLGIALRLGSDFNVPSKRASVKESYDRIILDAKESLEFLPDVPLHTFRPSKMATYGLLARAYLTMRVYDSALKYSNLCLSLNSNLMNYNDYPVSTSTSSPFPAFNSEIIFYTDMNQYIGDIATNRAKADTILFSSYNANDRRKSLFFVLSSGYQRFKGTYGGSLFTGIATDEIYLIRAECFARIGNKDAALADLNTLLVKRWNTTTFTAVTASNADDALNKILIERRKELVFRGLRWIDIKRLNKEGRNIIPTRIINGQIYTLQPNANYYALPLPTDIITITGMPQNPYP